MQILFYESSKSQEPHADSFGRKILSVVNNAITPPQFLLISKNNCWVIQVKSFSAARNVASPAPKLVISKYTSGPFGKKSFNCDQCNYLTTQAAHLSQHMRKHTGEKTFNQCNYSSIQAGNLENQIQTHLGEKSLKCYECNYWGSEASRVKVHKRQHTGEKPFKCWSQ